MPPPPPYLEPSGSSERKGCCGCYQCTLPGPLASPGEAGPPQSQVWAIAHIPLLGEERPSASAPGSQRPQASLGRAEEAGNPFYKYYTEDQLCFRFLISRAPKGGKGGAWDLGHLCDRGSSCLFCWDEGRDRAYPECQLPLHPTPTSGNLRPSFGPGPVSSQTCFLTG